VSASNQDILELLTPFVDGELANETARDVERRINDNPAYRRLLAAERATKRAVATRTTRYAAPAELGRRIRAMLFEGADPRTARTRRTRPVFWRLLTGSPAVATAVGAVALAIVLTLVIALFSIHRVTPFIRDVYAHHADPDRFPIQFEGDHQSVAAAASDAVKFPVIVPRLDEELALLGARECRLCGHLIAFIKYESSEGPVSFFVIPRMHPPVWRLAKRAEDEMIFYMAHHQGVHMAFWCEKTTTYCLAAALPEERVVELACAACRELQLFGDPVIAGVPPVRLVAYGRDAGL
jgi:anti-sigma factor RsiW